MTSALPPIEATTVPFTEVPFKYVREIDVKGWYFNRCKLQHLSLDDINLILNRNSATTFNILQINYYEPTVTSETETDFDLYNFSVKLPIKKTVKIRARFKSVSKFVPNISLD
jgi:hypothetical protein